jgi:hypothetical protein
MADVPAVIAFRAERRLRVNLDRMGCRRNVRFTPVSDRTADIDGGPVVPTRDSCTAKLHKQGDIVAWPLGALKLNIKCGLVGAKDPLARVNLSAPTITALGDSARFGHIGNARSISDSELVGSLQKSCDVTS